MKRLLKSIQKQRQSQQQPHHHHQSGKPNEIGVPHQSATTNRPTIQNHRPSQHAMVVTDPPPYSDDDDDEDVYHTHPNQNEYDAGVDDVYTTTNPQSPKKEEERNNNIVAEMERYYNNTNSSSNHHHHHKNKNNNSSHPNRNHPPNHNNNIHPHPSTTTHPPKAAWSAVPSPNTTTEETRDLVKQFIADVWNRGALDRIPNICSPSLRFNGNTGFDRVGHDGLARMVITIRNALEEYHCEIHSMVVEHNKAFCRLRFTGKHVGPLLGIPPTGHNVAWMGATEFTIQNHKILKVWELGDVKSLEEQLLVSHSNSTGSNHVTTPSATDSKEGTTHTTLSNNGVTPPPPVDDPHAMTEVD